jgi:hypothetical protein
VRTASNVRVRTLVGACSAIGGGAWVAACFVHNSLPQGCIDEQCGDRPMRGATPLDSTLFGVAGVMLAASGIGLLLLAGRSRPLGRLGALAGTTAAVGLLLLAAAGVVSAVDNEWNGMPGLVIPGILLLAVGLVLVAAIVLRARIVPAALAALLLVSALLLPFANEQTSRILLAVPFGLVWLALGVTLLRDRSRLGQPSTPVTTGM